MNGSCCVWNLLAVVMAMGTDVEMSKRKPEISDTFRLAVNTNKNRIWNILKKRYRELSELPVNSKIFILNNNNVVLDYNEDFDKEMSISDEDAYLSKKRIKFRVTNYFCKRAGRDIWRQWC